MKKLEVGILSLPVPPCPSLLRGSVQSLALDGGPPFRARGSISKSYGAAGPSRKGVRRVDKALDNPRCPRKTGWWNRNTSLTSELPGGFTGSPLLAPSLTASQAENKKAAEAKELAAKEKQEEETRVAKVSLAEAEAFQAFCLS